MTMRLNLGCGTDIRFGYTNVDCVDLPGVDVVCDLDVSPWPFPDECASEIIAFDVFEHVNDPLLFMFECGRILQTDGELLLHTCYWRSENAFTDPTHKRFCTEHTFDYWIRGTELYHKYGPAYIRGGAEFRKFIIAPEGQDLKVILRKCG